MKFGCFTKQIFTLLGLELLVGCGCLSAQASLTLSSGPSSGGFTNFVLSFTSQPRTAPAALQWMIDIPAGVSGVAATAGSALTSSNKTLACNGSGSGYACVAYGLGPEVIAAGTVATLSVPTTAGSVALSAAMGADLSGNAVPITPVNPTPPTLVTVTGLTCAPTVFNVSGSSTCKILLTYAAPAGGAGVTGTSIGASVTVPGLVTVPTGAS